MIKYITIFILVSVLLFFISIRLLPFGYDDAFIHFRIARNFVLYGNPYFNPSEMVFATSSFVWTVILSFIYIINHNLPVCVSIINSISTILGSIIWLRLLKKITANEIPLIMEFIFIISYIGILIPSSVGLMETPFAILILGIAILFLISGKKIGWAILGILVFIRLEFIVFIFVFAFSLLNLSKKNIYKSLYCLVLPLIVLSSIVFYYFHTLIPNTIIAKETVYKISSMDLVETIIYSLFPNINYLIPYRINYIFHNYQILFYLIITILLFTLIGIPWIRYFKDAEKKWGLLILVAGINISLGYIFNKTLIFDWYIPLFSIPILFGIFSLSVSRQPLTRITAIILSLLPISILAHYFLATFININYLPDVLVNERIERYTEVGVLLNKIFPDEQLLTSEIGALGYSYDGKIIDAAGLVSPAALKYHPMKVPTQRQSSLIGAIPAKFVTETNPEIIVSYPVFVKEFDKSTIKKNYEKISVSSLPNNLSKKLNSNKIWGSDSLFIYLRKDITEPKKDEYLKSKLYNTCY